MKRRIIAEHLTEPRSASGYLGSVLGVWLLSDVSYSDECRTKKYFQYAENIFPLFFAILKFFIPSIKGT